MLCSVFRRCYAWCHRTNAEEREIDSIPATDEFPNDDKKPKMNLNKFPNADTKRKMNLYEVPIVDTKPSGRQPTNTTTEPGTSQAKDNPVNKTTYIPARPVPKPLGNNVETSYVNTAFNRSYCRQTKKGDVVKVLHKMGNEMYVETENGLQGHFPAECIDPKPILQKYEWYFGNISRRECEEMLKQPPTNIGKFMVRDATSKPGDVCLSVLFSQTGVRHYSIPLGDPDYFKQHDKCVDLPSLIEHAQEIADRNFGRLGEPCEKSPVDVETDVSGPFTAVCRETVKIKNKLGSGQFGEVYKGTFIDSLEVAVKVSKPETVNPKELLMEAKVMQKLQHSKIVRLYAVVPEEPIWIITEFMNNDSLSAYLRITTDVSFDDKLYCAIQIADGMSYLESKKFIHRDLRASNVLVGDRLTCKIADFGLARCLNEEVYTSTGSSFPLRWAAPEVLREQKYSSKSDVWSYAVLLYEIFTNAGWPYKGMNNEKVKEYVQQENILPMPEGCNDVLYGRMKLCWKQNPDIRPSFSETLEFLRNEMSGNEYSMAY